MLSNKAFNISKILKGLIIAPNKMFLSLNSLSLKGEVLFLFIIGALLTFLKSFNDKVLPINFWADNRANQILSFFSIPQVKWFIAYMCFFLFLLLLKIFCRIILKKCNRRDLFYFFMAISGAGIMLQLLFWFLASILPKEINYLLSYFAFLWIFFLSLIAIVKSQNTTFPKAIIIYLISALPVVIITGLPGVSPFLMWLA
jgi:hypothetical protein